MQVEGIFVLRSLGPDQQGVLIPQAVANAKLVEHIGVVDRDVGDHEIRKHQQPKHVFTDVALPRDLAGRASLDACLLQRRSDQLPFHPIKVDAILRTERSHDKGARGCHDSCPLMGEALT
ncbi:hypothetical protein ACVIST_007884 [Bradyrhizobium elkanii]